MAISDPADADLELLGPHQSSPDHPVASIGHYRHDLSLAGYIITDVRSICRRGEVRDGQIEWEIHGLKRRVFLRESTAIMTRADLHVAILLGDLEPGEGQETAMAVDRRIATELGRIRSVLVYSSMELDRAQWCRLLVIDANAYKRLDPGAREVVIATTLLRPHYRNLRVHLGRLPGGMIDDDTASIECTEYWDFQSRPEWHAARRFTGGATETVGTPWSDLAGTDSTEPFASDESDESDEMGESVWDPADADATPVQLEDPATAEAVESVGELAEMVAVPVHLDDPASAEGQDLIGQYEKLAADIDDAIDRGVWEDDLLTENLLRSNLEGLRRNVFETDGTIDLVLVSALARNLGRSIVEALIPPGEVHELAMSLLPDGDPYDADTQLIGPGDVLSDAAAIADEVPTGRNRFAWTVEKLGLTAAHPAAAAGGTFTTIGTAAAVALGSSVAAASVFGLISGLVAATLAYAGAQRRRRSRDKGSGPDSRTPS